MPLCYSWLAVRGLPSESVLKLLELKEGGESPECEISEYAATQLAEDALLVISKHFEFADKQPLEALSAQGTVTTCCVNERLMYSSISRWQQRLRQWYFFHDGGLGIQHMHNEGDAPPEFHDIANRLTVAQAEGEGIAISVDQVFEVAAEVAHALTGFRYDGTNVGDAERSFRPLISTMLP